MSTETAVDPRIAKSNDALRTPMGEFWRKFKKQPVAMAAAGFVFFLIIVAIVGPMITPFDPENFFDYDRLNEGPSAVHWFGVDALGRDIFSRSRGDFLDSGLCSSGPRECAEFEDPDLC